MCRNQQRQLAEVEQDGPCEGQTQRLMRTDNRHAYRAFPWWTLWLIWPLMGLLKHASATFVGGWVSLGAWAIPANVVIAMVLMIVGIGLVLRQYRK